jgi:hypothetical protein
MNSALQVWEEVKKAGRPWPKNNEEEEEGVSSLHIAVPGNMPIKL